MSNLAPVNFLIIEDNQDHADLMISSLQEFNIKNEISHVLDGEAALAFLNNEPPYADSSEHSIPHLILLDIRMPKMDGISLLKIIKENDNFKHIPVIMVSTSKLESEIENCYRLGANGFVSKPLQFSEFTRKIKELNHYWVLTAEVPKLDKGT